MLFMDFGLLDDTTFQIFAHTHTHTHTHTHIYIYIVYIM